MPVIVMIGDSPSWWTHYRLVARTAIVLKGGKELKRMFPKGEPTRIRVINGDGGYVETTFTR